MWHIYIAVLFAWAISCNAQVQSDSIFIFNMESRQLVKLGPVTVPTVAVFDQTSSNIGALGNQALLSTIVPTANVFSGSNFTDLERAASHFDLSSYPLRTTVSILQHYKYYNTDSTVSHRSCSGQLVGPDLVLTAAHCVLTKPQMQIDTEYHDSIIVAPSFDEGKPFPEFGTIRVRNVVHLKNFQAGWNDIALLQLEQPIGKDLGWVAMGTASDTFFTNKVFHKFSYPGDRSPIDSTRFFNNDTLYYNYGSISVHDPSWLMVNSQEATGIVGMSGSQFLYTDNVSFTCFGAAIFSLRYFHQRYTPLLYYPFKYIIESDVLSLPAANGASFAVYPNPMKTSGSMRFTSESFELKRFYAVDINGKEIDVSYMTGRGQVTFSCESLSTGVYLIVAEGSTDVYRSKFFVLRD